MCSIFVVAQVYENILTTKISRITVYGSYILPSVNSKFLIISIPIPLQINYGCASSGSDITHDSSLWHRRYNNIICFFNNSK